MNCSNETMVGKFHLINPDEIEVTIYDAFEFLGDELEEYKMDKSNFLMEIYSQRDYLNFGEIVFRLPNPTKVLDNIEKNLEYFVK